MPDFERTGLHFVVRVPKGTVRLFRFVRSGRPGEGEFSSDRELGKRRRRRVQDSVDYLGISCFATLQQAAAFVIDLNDRLEAAHSSVSPFSHIVEIEILGSAGHAIAGTGDIAGHHTVWAEPEELVTNVRRVVPIE